ncbi:MAG: hypothetical protein MMC33_006531 [Icmadophila ericetorum]|nr:hypothetical protein [Icmadophila ericetorum]
MAFFNKDPANQQPCPIQYVDAIPEFADPGVETYTLLFEVKPILQQTIAELSRPDLIALHYGCGQIFGRSVADRAAALPAMVQGTPQSVGPRIIRASSTTGSEHGFTEALYTLCQKKANPD